jgi:hypothetical protein
VIASGSYVNYVYICDGAACNDHRPPQIAKAGQKHPDRSKSKWLENGAAPWKAKATKQPKSKSEPKKRPKSFRGFADVVRFLRRSPLLEHLYINICDSYRLFDQPANVEPIHLPRLLTLSLTADLSYLMPHLSAIPAPKDMLRVFTGGVPYNVNPIAHNATGTPLKEVFVHIWDMLDITQKTPIVDIINTHVPHCSSLKLTHPGTRIRTVAFSCAGSVGVLRSVLDPVRSIRVTGPGWPGLWDWAATDPLHHLASAESVEVAHMCNQRVPASLCAWLLARAGVNRRIRILDLRSCARQRQPDCVCDEAEKDSLQRMGPEFMNAGWAEMVLVEGRAPV